MPCPHSCAPTTLASCPPVRLWLTGPPMQYKLGYTDAQAGPPAADLVPPLPLAPPAGAFSASSSPCSSSWLLLDAGADLLMRLARRRPGGPPAAPARPLCSTLDGRPGSSCQSKLWSEPPGRSASAAAYRLRFLPAVERPPGSHQHRVGWGDTSNVRVTHKSCGACVCKDTNNKHGCSGSTQPPPALMAMDKSAVPSHAWVCKQTAAQTVPTCNPAKRLHPWSPALPDCLRCSTHPVTLSIASPPAAALTRFLTCAPPAAASSSSSSSTSSLLLEAGSRGRPVRQRPAAPAAAPVHVRRRDTCHQ